MAVSNKYFCFFNYCSVTVVPPFSPLLTPTLLPQFPHQSPLIFHAHESSIHVPLLAPSPSFPLLSPYPYPSGHCQIVLYFSVSGCILIAYLFCWLGIISLWNACSINLLNKLDIKQNTKNPRQLYVPLANGQKMEHYQCILIVFINLFLI